MFTVNTENLGNTLDYASVGGGKCYVLLIDPTVRDLGDGRTMQLASVCSSNGDKIGTANVEIRTTDMQKAEMFYVSGMLRQAVASLAPIADTLYIEPKDSCLEISDESGESMIKVPLTEKEAILEIPNSTEGAVMLRMKREEFVQAIRVGGYVAASTQMALSDAIGFKVDAENKTIKIMSFRAEMASIAITELAQVEAMGSNERPCPAVNVWHLVNYQFIQELVPKLTGEAVEIGFNDKYMQLMSSSASFGSKKMAGQMPAYLEKLLADDSYDYTGSIASRKLQIGLNIITVGSEENKVVMETEDNGALKISSVSLSNKTMVSQEKHDGQMPKMTFYVPFLKQILKVCGEKVQYYGKTSGNQSALLLFTGKENGVEYRSCVAACNNKQETE